MQRIALAVLAATCLGMIGCGDESKLASVSGVVKVDGKPYKNAIVSFQPVATGGSLNAGMGSTGLTDDDGRFILTTMEGRRGAVIGPHKVRIQTKRDDATAYVDPRVGSDDNPDPDGPKKKNAKVDPIPTEWYADTGGKEFTVPEGGTDKANFDIESAKPTKKK